MSAVAISIALFSSLVQGAQGPSRNISLRLPNLKTQKSVILKRFSRIYSVSCGCNSYSSKIKHAAQSKHRFDTSSRRTKMNARIFSTRSHHKYSPWSLKSTFGLIFQEMGLHECNRGALTLTYILNVHHSAQNQQNALACSLKPRYVPQNQGIKSSIKPWESKQIHWPKSCINPPNAYKNSHLRKSWAQQPSVRSWFYHEARLIFTE